MAVPSDSGEAPVQAIRGSTRGALNVFPFLRSTVPIREKTIFPLDRSQKTPCRKTIGKAFLWVRLTGSYESTIFFSPA